MAQVIAPPDAEAEAEDSAYYELPVEQVAASFDVDPARGLSSAEATARLDQYGANKFAEAKAEPRWRAFVRQYYDAMQIVLLVAGIASIVPLGHRTDMVFMNTNTTRGAGQLVVTATGMNAEVGHISNLLQHEGETETPLTRQLGKLTTQILLIAGIAVAISMILNLSRGDTFTTVFTAAIAFAVSAIPTGLPAVVTTILSMGTQILARANAIVKRLRATETLGSTSAINSDKTGTLTLNQMTAVELTIPGRRYTISGSGYSTEGTIKRVAGQPDVPLEQFFLPMILASDAVVSDGEMIGDPTEGALVVLAEKGGLDAGDTRKRFPR